MAWTKITKPLAGVWSWVNPFGRTTYDDPLNPYDDTQDFFDTVNQAAWTTLTKPASTSWTKVTKPL